MNLVSRQSLLLNNITLSALVLTIVASTSLVSQAGVMNSAVSATTTVTGDQVPISNGDEEQHGHDLINSLDQTCGMSSSSGGNLSITVSALHCHHGRYPAHEVILRLARQDRLLIPSPIPISLLKIPIEVA